MHLHFAATASLRDVRLRRRHSPRALHTVKNDRMQKKAPKPERVPLIDLADLTSSSDRNSAMAKGALAAACQDWGFFQVTNHGVSQELIQRFRVQCLNLFSLPMERKERAARVGFDPCGYSFRPQTGPSETFYVPGWDDSTIADYGHKLYHESFEEFSAVYTELNSALRILAIKILDLVIEGLGVDTRHFDRHRKEAQGLIGARYYHLSNAPDEILGLHAHVDWNLISIVHQNEVGGLQVLKDGKWYSIEPQSDTFAINVGDSLQVLTNGRLRSVQHRVVTSKTKPRLSFGYFLRPPPSITLVPAPDFVDPSFPPTYKPFTWTELVTAQKSNPLLPSPLAHFEVKR